MNSHTHCRTQKHFKMPRLFDSKGEEIQETDDTGTSHSQTILHGLNRLRQEGVDLDLTLCIQETTIKAHKLVLRSFTNYFEALLGAHMKEGSLSKIELHDLDPEAVKQLVDFAYTGKINITKENVQRLLETSSYLDVSSVCKLCTKFMGENLDIENCASVMNFATVYNLLPLKNKAKTFMTDNFHKIITSYGFLEMDINILTEVLASDELCLTDTEYDSPDNIYQETILLNGVIKYLEHDWPNRCNHVVDLLYLVRLPQVKREILEKLLNIWEPVATCAKAKVVVNAALHHNGRVSNVATKDWDRLRVLPGHRLELFGPYATGGQVQPEIEKFDHLKKMQSTYLVIHVTGMDIYIRRWDGRPVLGGLTVHYSNGTSINNGGTKFGHEEYKFRLEPDESINRLTIRCGFMIDSLEFGTTSGRNLGPYGGPGGGEKISYPSPKFGYLSSVKGTVVKSQGNKGITRLGFYWGFYRYLDQQPPDIFSAQNTVNFTSIQRGEGAGQ